MKAIRLLHALFATALACSSALAAQPSAQTVYRFSPVNQWDIQKTAAYWNPIIHYVSEKSGVKLELKIGRTSADTTAYVLAQEVEFVFSNHLFSPEREKLGWKVFGRRTGPALQGQIAVLEDSAVRQVLDLEGKGIVYAGPEAFIGYKLPHAELLNRNIKVNPVFAGNQNAAFAQLLAGKVEAVGSNSALIDGYAEKNGTRFRILWTSDSYLDLALMVSGKVGAKEAQAVSKAFLNMHKTKEGVKILNEVAEVVGMDSFAYFVSATDRDYDNYRKFYSTAPMMLR